MTGRSAFSHGRFSGLAGAVILALALVFATATPSLASDKPAAYVRAVSKQIIAAIRSGSPYTMANVVRRHSDLPDISLYSLGSYRSRLPSSRRSSYYAGVARFMGRYFIAQSRLYPVTRIDVMTPSSRASWGHNVDSRITLRNGSTYTLRWLVVPRRGGYKVRDVSILGVWITPISMVNQQKDLFENYIEEHGGKVSALLKVLGS
jgi:ABC-type transporter MlaC component